MIKKTEAIQMLQKHMDTYEHQVRGQGWEIGVTGDTIQEMLGCKEEAQKQVEAYQMAIQALESSSSDDWIERCYLGLSCPYQHQN